MIATHAAPMADPTHGIVWAYHFDIDGKGALLPPEQVASALETPGSGWTWVHLGLADTRCRTWIGQHAPLSDIAREILLGTEEHLRLDILGHEILGVLPDLQQDLAHSTDDLVRLRFVMTDRMVITARRKPVHSVELTRRTVDAGRRFPHAMSFLDAIVDHFADAIGQLAERLGSELDAIEDHILHEEPADERRRIGKVRLKSVRVHRHLVQLRNLFQRLEPRLSDNALAARTVRTLAQKLDALDHDVAAMHDRARLLLDEVAAKMTSITNRRLFTLSVLTACLLPPTLVTGFFGMNTKDLPFAETAGGTWYALMVAMGAGGFIYWVLRKLRAL